MEQTLPAADMERIRQMVLAGRRTEAAAEYRRLAGVDAAAAEATITAMVQGFALNTVRRQKLTASGWGMMVFTLALFPVGIGVWQAWECGPVLAVVIWMYALLNLWIFGMAALVSLRYLGSPAAQAEIRNLVHIGALGKTQRRTHIFKTLLEVRPKNGAPFQAEMMLPVRESRFEKMRPGLVFQVRYRPGEVNGLVFDKTLSD